MSKCKQCNGTGVWETGNNDLPCSCPAGDSALFNQAGMDHPITGAELRHNLFTSLFDTSFPHSLPHFEIKRYEDVKVAPGSDGVATAHINKSEYHAWQCPRCGEPIGVVGRVMQWLFGPSHVCEP